MSTGLEILFSFLGTLIYSLLSLLLCVVSSVLLAFWRAGVAASERVASRDCESQRLGTGSLSNSGLFSLQEINGITAALAEELFEKGVWPGVPETVGAAGPALSGSQGPRVAQNCRQVLIRARLPGLAQIPGPGPQPSLPAHLPTSPTGSQV